MNKTEDKKIFIEQMIDLCAEHRKNCKEENCSIDTLFIAEFLRKYLDVPRDKYLDMFRGRS